MEGRRDGTDTGQDRLITSELSTGGSENRSERIWRIWQDLGGFGRIWENLGGFGRIWKGLRSQRGLKEAWKSLGGALGGPGTPLSVRSAYFGVFLLLYNKRVHYPPGHGLPQDRVLP